MIYHGTDGNDVPQDRWEWCPTGQMGIMPHGIDGNDVSSEESIKPKP